MDERFFAEIGCTVFFDFFAVGCIVDEGISRFSNYFE